MIRILHSVSNMDRAGIETMLMNYYRYMDKSKVQFDFLCNTRKNPQRKWIRWKACNWTCRQIYDSEESHVPVRRICRSAQIR